MHETVTDIFRWTIAQASCWTNCATKRSSIVPALCCMSSYRTTTRLRLNTCCKSSTSSASRSWPIWERAPVLSRSVSQLN